MRTWRDAALHLFLQEPGSVAQRTSKNKVALLAAAAARNESAQRKEASSLVRNLIQVVRELEAPQLGKWPSDSTSIPLRQGPLPAVISHGQTKAEAHSFPSVEATSHNAFGGTTLPQPDSLSLDDGWLDWENSLHAEESWLLDTRSESSSDAEGKLEGSAKDRCREVESTGRQEMVERDVLLEAPGVSPDGGVAEEESRPHDSDMASGLEWLQLLKSAKRIIVAYQKTGRGSLQELRAVCKGLEKQRVIRLAEIYSVSRRLSELQARASQWRMRREPETDTGATAAGAEISWHNGVSSCSAGVDASAQGAACRTENSGEAEKDGSPGWPSLDQIDAHRLRVHRLEAVLAATCQEMVGRLGALWDQLRVPLGSRVVFEAEEKGRDVLARYDCLEQQLVQVQAQVTLLQPIILLCQQRDELGRQLESQTATCREASKHLLSRKADGASALRRAEAERKRLLRQQSTVQKQLGGAIREWEKVTGVKFEEDLFGQRWSEDVSKGMQKEALGCVERSEKSVCIKKGRAVGLTSLERARSWDGKETVLVPVPANIV